MGEISKFGSRTGILKCSQKSAFVFLSDFRNLEGFIPADTVKDLVVSKDSCSFRIDMLGTVNLFISSAEEYSEIDYKGTIPQVKDFSATVGLKEAPGHGSAVTIVLSAELNPFIRMMVNDAISRGLESVITAMEGFNGWPSVQ